MLIGTLLGIYALLTVVLFRLSATPFDSDEALHALAGMEMAADLYHGNVGLLFEHLYFRDWYPPSLPAYLAPFLLILGPATWSARYPIVLLTVVFLALVYRAGQQISRNATTGMAAFLLTGTSPLLWVHSLVVMEELLAMIGVMLVVIATIRMKRRRIRPFWVGVALAFTLIAKLSIGIPVIGGVLLSLMTGSESFWSKARTVARAFTPLGVFVVLWWGHPAKIRDFVDYVRASPPAYQSMGWAEVTYYWRGFLTAYRAVPFLGILSWSAIVTACFRWEEMTWRLPLSIVVMKWIVLLLERQINVRFFVAAAAVTSLLTAQWLATYVPRFYQAVKSRYVRVAVFAVGALIAMSGVIYLGARLAAFPFLMAVSYETDPAATRAHAWMADQMTYDHPILFVNGWDQFSSQAFDFAMGARTWPDWETTRVVDVLLKDPEEAPDAVEQFWEALDSASERTVVHLTNAPVPNAGAWWAYRPAIEPCLEKDGWRRQAFQIELWDGGLRDRILAQPFLYAQPRHRSTAREMFRYPLSIDVKVTTCQ
jgi:hypothetical protein